MARRVHEYDDVHSFFFRPDKPVHFRAGQYTHLHLGGLPSPRSIRELSFASAPSEDELRFTVHIGSGTAYKRKLDALRDGEEVGVFRSGGHTTLPEHPDGRARVLMGGGVGMAPFRSLARDQASAGTPLHVLQVQRGPADAFLFHRDFEDNAASYHRAAPEQFDTAVANMAAAVPDAVHLLCGSARFVRAARLGLLGTGVPEHDIASEVWR